MSANTIQLSLDVNELLCEFIPKIVKEFLRMSGAAKELSGTTFSLVVELSGKPFRYLVKDGQDFDVAPEDLSDPMVRASLSQEDMEKFILMENVDMLLGIQEKLSRSRYDALQKLKGSCDFAIEVAAGQVADIHVVFNGAESPNAVFSMGIEQAKDMVTGRVNPVNQFMSGQLKITGDIAFAMSLQPFFA